ncbi:MAG TPA: hypothetical protein EYP90_00005, partial [Chromatiaceae bacterium]|nr:hypothetical protein [Chromatiaceae bacterium]
MSQFKFSVAEFKTFISDSIETVQTLSPEEVVPYTEKQISTLIDADFLYILSYRGLGEYFIPTLEKRIKPDLSSKHLFSEVISKQHSLLLNDLEHSLLYDDIRDNLINKTLQEVLLVPVKNTNIQNEKLPEIMVWAALTKESNYSFSQKTILYLIKFLENFKPYLQNLDSVQNKVSNSTKQGLKQCIDHTEFLESVMERNKHYFHSIIHDIRTPMNALIGFLGLLKINETDPTKIDYIDSSIKSGEHMIRLINDALDFAKIESGELSIEKTPFDLHDTLTETAKIFYETAKKKKILLSTYLDPSIPNDFTSDRYRITQVLSNLLSNALKFTPEKGNILIEAIYH